MKIVLMHFHLKTGGVTTVIRHQLACLKGWADVIVLSGEAAPKGFPAEAVHIPGIAYDSVTEAPADPVATAHAIQKTIRAKWPAGCDIMHVHNPLLAKNRVYLRILKHLQAMGIRLLLQVHDFAEDGRPDVYFAEEYPDKCCYGVINSRDYRIMQKAGGTNAALFKMFNMVNPLPTAPTSAAGTNYILYPVRALRRKNIGEAILLSLFFPQASQLAITLPPNSPADQAAYNGWQAFVGQHQLNVAFEMGLKHTFSKLVQGAESFLTTSIMEGFGFCFLEPWTAGKLLWGRRLPGICDDFEAAGINLDHLYRRLAVPVAWIGEKILFEKWSQVIKTAAKRFNISLKPDELSDRFKRMTPDHTVDFGLLAEIFQKSVITRIIESSATDGSMIELNPFLKHLPTSKANGKKVAANRQAVLSAYSQAAYTLLLKRTYQAVLECRADLRIDKKELLNSFFAPDNAGMLKWSQYVG